MAVGTVYSSPLYHPLVERWDGERWSAEILATPPGFGGGLLSVSCTSSTACTAVGNYFGGYGSLLSGGPLIERWNGATWSQQAAPDLAADADLTGVSCASRTTCTLVGTPSPTTVVEKWDGTSWTHEPTPNPSGFHQGPVYLSAISCPTTVNCIAVGTNPDSGAIALQSTTGQPAAATLSGIPVACILAPFTARVQGSRISTVTWLLDGTRITGQTIKHGVRYAASIRVAPGSHHLTVLVKFKASSHTPARTFHRRVSACPPAVPRFTG
jgi:hypothetical protein